MQVQTNAPNTDRIQIILTPLLGPLSQNGPLGDFDPRRDIEVYVDGQLIPVRTFTFDATYNRYLLYMDKAINLQGVIQLVHHMPSPPFLSAVNPPLYDLTLGEDPDIDEGG
jgi:hypothetical protein